MILCKRLALAFLLGLIGVTGVYANDHHRSKVVETACCTTCGISEPGLAADLTALSTNPDEHERARAARHLKSVDWRCHPEVVATLSTALLVDCCGSVRRAAVESLAKMAPCTPEAHMALSKAAASDKSLRARLWAKKALKRIGKRCSGPCSVCGTTLVQTTPGVIVSPQDGTGSATPLEPAPEPSLTPLPGSPSTVAPGDEPPPPVPSPSIRNVPAGPGSQGTQRFPNDAIMPARPTPPPLPNTPGGQGAGAGGVAPGQAAPFLSPIPDDDEMPALEAPAFRRVEPTARRLEPTAYRYRPNLAPLLLPPARSPFDLDD